MSEELDEFDEQLRDIVTAMRKCLDTEVSKLTGAARLEKCEYLKNRLTRGRQLHKSITVETRELPPDKRAPWIEKAKAYDTELVKLQQDINWATTSASTDAKAAGAGVRAAKGLDNMTAKEMTTAAKEIQQDSLQSTSRAKQAIMTTIQIGTETSDVLKQQTEQIQRVSKTVDEIESNFKRADKQLRSIMRRMATDKIILVFTFLVVIGVVGAILVSVFDPKQRLGKKVVDTIDPIVGSVQKSL